MEHAATGASAKDLAFDLARWYHELAAICVQAAEQHLGLTEQSPLSEVDRAIALNDVIRIRMATVQSVERSFRSEFPRAYVDHHVSRILSLDSGPIDTDELRRAAQA
jgi:hypothetical protein